MSYPSSLYYSSCSDSSSSECSLPGLSPTIQSRKSSTASSTGLVSPFVGLETISRLSRPSKQPISSELDERSGKDYFASTARDLRLVLPQTAHVGSEPDHHVSASGEPLGPVLETEAEASSKETMPSPPPQRQHQSLSAAQPSAPYDPISNPLPPLHLLPRPALSSAQRKYSLSVCTSTIQLLNISLTSPANTTAGTEFPFDLSSLSPSRPDPSRSTAFSEGPDKEFFASPETYSPPNRASIEGPSCSTSASVARSGSDSNENDQFDPTTDRRPSMASSIPTSISPGRYAHLKRQALARTEALQALRKESMERKAGGNENELGSVWSSEYGSSSSGEESESESENECHPGLSDSSRAGWESDDNDGVDGQQHLEFHSPRF
ncbi:hypothetical protein [Phaffia rhodozyma]|uniref:Uncharacterized protein n=1 Tax=Phaffia rhodozyma TaxID=264483 RepID=A0A0F7ST13_PHARH|nr:hypothetical protein [Phaffia rhodozyma]